MRLPGPPPGVKRFLNVFASIQPQDIPKAVLIPPIKTVLQLPVHSDIRLADVLDGAPPDVIIRANYLFDQNFRTNFESIQRFEDPICRPTFRKKVRHEVKEHARLNNDERLARDIARERAHTKIEDWDSDPTASHIRFAALRRGSVIGTTMPTSSRSSIRRLARCFSSTSATRP